MADVAVNTGRSARRIAGVGVDVLGGSHCSDCCCWCWGRGEGAGPSGWYGIKTSAAWEASRSRLGLRAGLRDGLAATGELGGSGILCGNNGCCPRAGVDGPGTISTGDESGKYCWPGDAAGMFSGTARVGGLDRGAHEASAGDDSGEGSCSGVG